MDFKDYQHSLLIEEFSQNSEFVVFLGGEGLFCLYSQTVFSETDFPRKALVNTQTSARFSRNDDVDILTFYHLAPFDLSV